MLAAYIQALFIIFIAEMGDKSQLLAMIFATKYKVRYVLLGVIIGAFANHGIAVWLGTYLSDIIPLGLLQVVAGILFVFFGLWGLRVEGEEEDENVKEVKLGPVFTVGFAYFISELGDKTQLMAITLSTQTEHPLALLAGTVSGMVLTGAIGIYIGSKLGSKIPELGLKIVSSIIFIFMGSLKLHAILPLEYTTLPIMAVYFTVIGFIAYRLISKNLSMNKASKYKVAAEHLYDYTHEIKHHVENICLGCKNCIKGQCIIGYTKEIINMALESENMQVTSSAKNNTFHMKEFDKEKVLQGLQLTIDCIKTMDESYSKDTLITELRQAFELILFNKSISYDGSFDSYLANMAKYDKDIAEVIKKHIKE